MTNLIVWPEFIRKKVFSVENVKNVKIKIEFYIFELD